MLVSVSCSLRIHGWRLHMRAIDAGCSLQLPVRDLQHECVELFDMLRHKPRRRCTNLRVQCRVL